jgi:hypothetical protein
VLGPLLFLLYVNDIADNLLNLTRLFADHASLSYSSQSPYTIEDVINSDLESISIWSKQWLVNFNPQKTKAMVFFNNIIRKVADQALNPGDSCICIY